MTDQTQQKPSGPIPTSAYFKTLAGSYIGQTGGSTHDLFVKSLDLINTVAPISRDSILHDNGAGPGISSFAAIAYLPSNQHPSKVYITDSSPAMIEAAQSYAAVEKLNTSSLIIEEMDAMKLKYEDASFTHSFMSFTISVLPDPLQALREMHRTLQAGGAACVLTWKIFGAVDVIRAAQAAVRPDLPSMPLPGSQFLGDGVLANLVAEAGFPKADIVVEEREHIVHGELLSKLILFLKSDAFKLARRGYTEEEEGLWMKEVDKYVEGQVKEIGGVRFQAWVLIAKRT